MSDFACGIDRLKEMVKKPFLYQNEEIVILNYCDCLLYTSDAADE